MDGFKEFQGRTLDEAISEACAYYDAARERLEIDIVQDSKTGIFGLVGARKAKIRARRMQLRDAVGDALGRKNEATGPENDAPDGAVLCRDQAERQERGHGKPQANKKGRPEAPLSPRKAAPKPVGGVPEERSGETAPSHGREECEKPAAGKTAGRRKNGRNHQTEQAPPLPVFESGLDEVLADEAGEGFQHIPFGDLDRRKLRALSLEVVSRLVEPIAGSLPVEVELQEGRVSVSIDCGDDSGLLIGREGQTLASLQYLASRMVSHGMGAAVRVQLDAGEYRRRQDERLHEMALALAERVRETGKACSTRPLSSYHRRIVHVALQDAPDVQTRSSGEGALKRVVVQRKRT